MSDGHAREFGLDRGKVFPAANARSLLNPLRRLVQSARRTVAAAAFEPDARVLELGCGPGFFSPWVARATSGTAVLLDLQMEMLQLARDRVRDQDSAVLVQADGTRLPLASSSFDGVLIATVLGEIPDHDGCFREVHRILRDGGVLAVAETRRDSDFIKLEDLKALVEPRGFQFVAKRGIPWQYVARFGRV
jgi:ubiquinone/menaquinone biosynthesis C-methylase UbiE